MAEGQEGERKAWMHAEPGRKETGLAHLLAASRYSVQGFLRLTREAAFRHELVAFGAALAAFLFVGATAVEFLVLTVLALVLFSVEALNTAIEEIVDRVSPEFSVAARHAKDLGSFAVFCLLLAMALYVGSVLFF